jgi:hypothetical protein
VNMLTNVDINCCLANGHFGKLPFGKLPFGKLPFGKLPFGKLPFGKLPFGKLPSASCHSANYRSGNVPEWQLPLRQRAGMATAAPATCRNGNCRSGNLPEWQTAVGKSALAAYLVEHSLVLNLRVISFSLVFLYLLENFLLSFLIHVVKHSLCC